jgi:hypothetical protein
MTRSLSRQFQVSKFQRKAEPTVIVDPDPALKVTFLAFDFFGSDIEDKAVQFIFLLLAYVENVVFRQVCGGEHERQFVADILHVFPGHENFREAGLRRKYHVFDALAFVVEQDVEDFMVLAVHGRAIDGLHFHVLAIGVLLASFGELGFFLRETLNYLIRSDVLGGSIFQRALLGQSGNRPHDGQQAYAEQKTAE